MANVNNGIHWDGWPHRADGWVYIVKPHTECQQPVSNNELEERSDRLDRYRELADKEQPLFREV